MFCAGIADSGFTDVTYIDDWNAEQREVAARWREKHRALRSALADIRVRGISPKGELGVSVDANGKILDIRLTPQALRLGDDRLAQLLLKTVQRAQDDAGETAAAAAKPFTDDPEAADAIALIRELLD